MEETQRLFHSSNFDDAKTLKCNIFLIVYVVTATHQTVQLLAHICFVLLLAMQPYLKKSRCDKLFPEHLVTLTRTATCQPTQDSNNTSTKKRGLTFICASHRAKMLFQNLWMQFLCLVLACIQKMDDDNDDDYDDYDDDENNSSSSSSNNNNNNNSNCSSSSISSSNNNNNSINNSSSSSNNNNNNNNIISAAAVTTTAIIIIIIIITSSVERIPSRVLLPALLAKNIHAFSSLTTCRVSEAQAS